MKNQPFISIVIPSKRHNTVVKRCLNSLIRQSYPKNRYEIILLTEEKKQFKHSVIKSTAISHATNHAQARNIGVAMAKGEIIAFCDDDCLLPKNWLKTAAAYFKKNRADLLSGPAIPPLASNWLERLSGYLTGSRFTVGFAAPRYRNLFPEREAQEFDLILANTFISKKLFNKFGGFSINQVPCEENFLYAKLKTNGHILLYVPALACIHPAKLLILPWAKKIFFYATGRGSMILRFPATFHPQYLIPSLFLLIWISLILTAPFLTSARLGLLGLVSLYGVFNLLNILYIFSRFERHLGFLVMAPITTFVIHSAYGLGFLYGLWRYLTGHRQAYVLPIYD